MVTLTDAWEYPGLSGMNAGHDAPLHAVNSHRDAAQPLTISPSDNHSLTMPDMGTPYINAGDPDSHRLHRTCPEAGAGRGS